MRTVIVVSVTPARRIPITNENLPDCRRSNILGNGSVAKSCNHTAANLVTRIVMVDLSMVSAFVSGLLIVVPIYFTNLLLLKAMQSAVGEAIRHVAPGLVPS